MISVIIPAHNEETVIGRGLSAVTGGAPAGALDVIVVCNGCSDRTAEIARRWGPPVRVLEIQTASKIAALNAGDAAASGFPRVYIDADVRVSWSSLEQIGRALERGTALAAWPQLRMNFTRSGWFVRAFYAVFTALPYNQEGGVVGTGVYALSEAGRARFASFPDIIADDGFVRFCFAPGERLRVEGAVSEVDAPQTLWGLIKIKTRSKLGQYQLRQKFPDMPTADRKSLAKLGGALLLRPRLWPCLPVYLVVNLVTRWRARRQLHHTPTPAWERDDSRPRARAAL